MYGPEIEFLDKYATNEEIEQIAKSGCAYDFYEFIRDLDKHFGPVGEDEIMENVSRQFRPPRRHSDPLRYKYHCLKNAYIRGKQLAEYHHSFSFRRSACAAFLSVMIYAATTGHIKLGTRFIRVLIGAGLFYVIFDLSVLPLLFNYNRNHLNRLSPKPKFFKQSTIAIIVFVLLILYFFRTLL